MPAVATSSEVERLMLDRVVARGWTVVGSQRAGRDLEAQVQCGPVRGRLRFLHHPSVQEGPDEQACSVELLRIDLGDIDAAPELWCVLEDDYPVSDSEQGRPRQVTQVAIGKRTLAIATGVFGPSNSGSSGIEPDIEIWRLFADRPWSLAEQLRPDRPWEERRAILTELLRRDPLRRWWSPRRRAAIAAAGVLALLVGWYLDNSWVGLAGIAVGAYGLLTFGAAVGDQWLARRRARGHWRDIAEDVKVVFSRLEPTGGSASPLLLPLRGGRGEVHLASAQATSRRTALRAKLELAWIEGANPADGSLVLPTRWLAIELSGPEALVRRFPSGPREIRTSGRVRWTFTGDELKRGEVTRQLATVADSI